MKEVWGPWTVHDGGGCPLPGGTIVEVVFQDRFGYQSRAIGCTGGDRESSWNWACFPQFKKILRYRVKRPKGLQMLQDIVESLDIPAKPEFV